MTVTPPDDQGPSIPGLTVVNGFQCVLLGCNGELQATSRSRGVVLRHRNRIHGREHRGKSFGVQAVQLQTFFREPNYQRWFVVSQDMSRTPDGQCEKLPKLLAPVEQQSFQTFLEDDLDAFDAVDAVQSHVEETPWLRRTGFHKHLEDCDKELLALAVSNGHHRWASSCLCS